MLLSRNGEIKGRRSQKVPVRKFPYVWHLQGVFVIVNLTSPNTSMFGLETQV